MNRYPTGVMLALVGAATSGVRASAQGSMPESRAERPPVVNECATPKPGWVWCDDFEQDRLRQYFEYDDASHSFVRATGAGMGKG